MACTLDPRFKFKWCKNESERCYQKGILLSKMPSIEITTPPSPIIIENLESNSEATKPNKNSLFSFMEYDEEEHTTIHSTLMNLN